jgi:hypothetical protein
MLSYFVRVMLGEKYKRNRGFCVTIPSFYVGSYRTFGIEVAVPHVLAEVQVVTDERSTLVIHYTKGEMAYSPVNCCQCFYNS